MSQVSDQQTSPWQQPNLDPKAAAKAAKAYAKATRPFYKKKRFIIPAAAVAIGIAVSAGGGGGSDDGGGPKVVDSNTAADTAGTADNDKSKSDESKSDESAKPGTKENPIKKGQTVELEGTRYTVKAAKTSPTVGDQFFEEKADGTFVIVTLTIENTKDESKIFSDAAAAFVAKDGTSYETDSDATFAAVGEGDDLFLKEMHPDLPTTGNLIFDVPPTKVKGGVLEVSDLFGNGEAYIKLGF